MVKGICKICNKKFEGRKDKICCSKYCSRKLYRQKNKKRISENFKKWVNLNSKHRKKYMKKYRSTDKYREMKQKHDKTYREKHGDKKTNYDSFKRTCRAYASNKIKKERCVLCNSKESLELHHSKGYKKKCVDGVIVVCRKCHRQVIHGRGSRIDGTRISSNY
jgi:hypothetical protein